MYRLLSLILCAGLATGCTNSARYTETALSWETAPTHLLITALGNPTFFYPAEDRGDILFWHFKKEADISSYVKQAKGRLLGTGKCANAQMSFSEKTLCRPRSNSGLGLKTSATFVESNGYDCQIVATLSEDGATIKKIDVLAEGNCDILQFDNYQKIAARG